jgi:hypothetical protein
VGAPKKCAGVVEDNEFENGVGRWAVAARKRREAMLEGKRGTKGSRRRERVG